MRKIAKKAFATSIFTAALLASAAALAHDGSFLPTEVRTNQIEDEGKLIACTIEFMMPIKDAINRSPEAISFVTGSINLIMAEDGHPATRYKLVGMDVASDGLERFKVATVSLFDGKGKAYPATSIACGGDDHDYCGETVAESFQSAADAIAKTGSLHIDFNRTIDGAHVPIDIAVSNKEAPKLVACAKKMDLQAIPAAKGDGAR